MCVCVCIHSTLQAKNVEGGSPRRRCAFNALLLTYHVFSLGCSDLGVSTGNSIMTTSMTPSCPSQGKPGRNVNGSYTGHCGSEAGVRPRLASHTECDRPGERVGGRVVSHERFRAHSARPWTLMLQNQVLGTGPKSW